MTDREKLVELLRKCVTQNITTDPDIWDGIVDVNYGGMADLLLARGVIVLPCRIDLLRNGIRAMSEEELAAWCAAASAEPFPTATTSAALAAAIMSAALRKEGQ